MKSRAALPLLALSLSSCFYSAERGTALEAKILRMEKDDAEVRTELANQKGQLAAQLPRLDQKLHEIQDAMAKLDKSARRSGADLGVQLDKMAQDLASLRGNVDEYVHKIGELQTALDGLRQDTDQKIAALKSAEEQQRVEAEKKAKAMERPKDKKAFFELAMGKLKEGDLALARQLLGEFLRKWKDDPLAADAHFELGNIHFGDEKCTEAVAEYGEVFKRFPKSERAPEALWRSSECFSTLKMADAAKSALEEIVSSYPKSEAAQRAKKKLAEKGTKGNKKEAKK